MKKFLSLLAILGVLLVSGPAHALILNDNTDPGFEHRVTLIFVTKDVTYDASTSSEGSLLNIAGSPDYDRTNPVGSQSQREYVMPFGGSIIGISIAARTAVTGGSATADVTVNGTKTGVDVSLHSHGTDTQGQYNYASDVNRFTKIGDQTFSAGQRIGVAFDAQGNTAGSDIAPSGNDFVVTVIVDVDTMNP